MKIFCIGRNYAKHAHELNNKLPSEPLVFMKPQTALLKNGQDFYYPSFTNDLHYECELVLKIGKNGKAIHPQFALDYVTEVTVGIDFTARDIQDQLKEKGHPWEKAKAFDFSAPIGKFIPAMHLDWKNIHIGLEKNKTIVQQGNTKDLLFSIPELIVHISQYFTLQTGDLIFTGTPEGVGAVNIGDQLTGYLNKQQLLSVSIQ